ncbi:phosphoribosylaminoimidazolesuccinocarboxamide synthase [[Limnothrix rosea] IAM M-220]|uniref:phosphoribosylaminoimidazolesuccinocarboxamide synthase n=1 Tax=[Limnothrix rosea] IAM M-220 TaxID=454133 RepID=UPI00096124DF|nr:phosphoribosylaminoimidazolesuccinocarboxamide synthase [[Limnothrix rosea] IAM M-220]OKH15068.1 phosphoribosylaminoimidazolesuccinocarboxamide synthase [[Limnothrix rosea] IAM M-220]
MSDHQPQKMYEGKAKILYSTADPEVLLTYFKDDATAFNAQKKGTISGKGEVNCTIASVLLKWLETKGIPTHFIDQPKPDEMLVKAVTILPVEVVVRNIAAGSLCKQTGLEQGTVLPNPLVEFFLKDDDLGDPLLTRDRLALLNIVTPEQVQELTNYALKINALMQEFFTSCDITLVDFKIEFGTDKNGVILLADEISPDTCRLWDNTITDANARVMDKDRFRKDLGNVEDAYQAVQTRVLDQAKALMA